MDVDRVWEALEVPEVLTIPSHDTDHWRHRLEIERMADCRIDGICSNAYDEGEPSSWELEERKVGSAVLRRLIQFAYVQCSDFEQWAIYFPGLTPMEFRQIEFVALNV